MELSLFAPNDDYQVQEKQGVIAMSMWLYKQGFSFNSFQQPVGGVNAVTLHPMIR